MQRIGEPIKASKDTPSLQRARQTIGHDLIVVESCGFTLETMGHYQPDCMNLPPPVLKAGFEDPPPVIAKFITL